MIKGVNHIGIVVSNLAESMALYERIMGVKPHDIEEVPTQGVKVAFFRAGRETDVELLEPIDPDNGIAKYLKNRGPGFHHICFEVDDVDKELKTMAEKGISLIDRQAKNEPAGKVGFLHPKSTNGVLIELIQPKT